MTDQNDNLTGKAVGVAKGISNRTQNLNEVTVSTGVVFKVKEVPQFTMSDIRREFKEPVPPTWFNQDTGRKEQNPNDPEFKRLHGEYLINMSMAIIDIMILLGTEVKTLPKDMPGPKSEEWRRQLAAILRTRGWARDDIANLSEEESYIYWVKYKAAAGGMEGDDSDISKITVAIGRLTGVTEEDVSDAVDTFRDTN